MTMILSTPVKLALLLWLVAECVAFIAVAHLLGAGTAILLGIGASALGAWLLKRRGRAAMIRLRAQLNGRAAADGTVLDDTLAAAGAIALILPGFLSDIAGLALSLPWARDQVGRLLRRRGAGLFAGIRRGNAARDPFTPQSEAFPADDGRPRRPPTIDLDEGEWRAVERRSDGAFDRDAR